MGCVPHFTSCAPNHTLHVGAIWLQDEVARVAVLLRCVGIKAKMIASQSFAYDLSESFDDKLAVTSTPQRSNALANKLSSVLSASYADSEIRDALRILDDKQVRNTAEARRRVRLDVQKEVIERNGDIIKDFGQVAEVRSAAYLSDCRH